MAENEEELKKKKKKKERKWRTKEPLNESEKGEWKSWLKVQHSEN